MRLPADTIRVSVQPSGEPVSVSEARAHLRVDSTDATELELIGRLITAARRYAERVSRKSFITQTLTGGLDAWPGDGVIMLPYIPVQSVTSITYVDQDGNTDTVSSTVYGVDTKRGRVYLKQNQTWPSEPMRDYDPITITWVAGYGSTPSAVPAEYRQAILLLVGHFYENRELAVVGQGVSSVTVPMAVDALLLADRGY